MTSSAVGERERDPAEKMDTCVPLPAERSSRGRPIAAGCLIYTKQVSAWYKLLDLERSVLVYIGR